MRPPLQINSDQLLRARLLGNGTYSAVLTAAGTGISAWCGYALNAWNADRTEDTDGIFFYLHDLDRGSIWSAGFQPTASLPGAYVAEAHGGSFFLKRFDDGIETTMRACVAPDCDVELRVLVIANVSGVRRRIAVSTFCEVVLLDAAAHAAHPAFTKLFVQTEIDAAAGTLLARRRKRAAGDPSLWMLHAFHGPGELQFETDRARFVGRGRTKVCPAAIASTEPLGGAAGNVLDPVFSLRRVVELAPGEAVQLMLVSTAGESRDAVIANAGRFTDGMTALETFAAAATAETTLRLRLSITERELIYFDSLAAALLYAHPVLHPGRTVPGDRSAVLADLDFAPRGYLIALEALGERARDVARELLAGQSYWKRKGLEVDLAIVTDDVRGMRRECNSRAATAGEPPRVTILSSHQMPDEKRDLLYTTAHALIRDRLPRLETLWVQPPVVGQLGREPVFSVPPPSVESVEPVPGPRPLRVPATKEGDRNLDGGPPPNGIGTFSDDGREYVLHLGPQVDGTPRRPPMPWINVIANDNFGFLASESGAGFCWSRNSREHRLTPWYNDPVSDPHGEALYLRDEDTGEFWSPLPGPCPGPAAYEVRHGFGYSTWRHVSNDLEQEVTMFVPAADPVKIVRVRVRNTSRTFRQISLFSYHRLVMGALPSETCRTVVTEIDGEMRAVLGRNHLAGDFGGAVAFAAAQHPGALPARFGGDRGRFIGVGGSPRRPAAVASGDGLDGSVGSGLDPCLAVQVTFEAPPDTVVECAFLIGEAQSHEAVARLVSRYRVRNAIAAALEEVQLFWRRMLSAVRVRTPVPAIDLMVNGWLEYQTLSCRLWARSAFYQSGGAFGFRDQLQDAAALIYADATLTRGQLLLHAAHQFVEGDVLHWWHPPSGRGTRTRFSDDLLWMPYVAAFYARVTGDWAVFDERAGYVTARALRPGEDEAYLLPQAAEEQGTLYEHCCRALDRSLTRGAHGLPLMGTGDWNDGMNRVGRKGAGESVWLGFFLYAILGDFVPICERFGDAARARRYGEYRRDLLEALNQAGWDGAWYLRAYYDDGTPLGSAGNDECRIDVLAQAWAVISGAAPPERALQAMAAVDDQLISAEGRLIRLLTPPFDRTPHDPGYIKGYVPGIRENGGQYTHAAMWTVRAFAELGRHDRAAALLEMLSPVTHAATEDDVATYRVEPYVVAADIYGVEPHVGRGGWTWYTGSAGWMHRVAVESVLGMTIEGGKTLRLKPCIPDSWPGFNLTYRLTDYATRYEIEVVNGGGGIRSVSIDGEPGTVADGAAVIDLREDGGVHRVRVEIGAASAAVAASQQA